MNRSLRIGAIVIAIVVAMIGAAEFFQPIALAMLLGFVLTPLVQMAEQRLRMPRAAAVLLTITLVGAGVGGVGYVVFRQVMTLAAELPSYQRNIDAKLHLLKPNPESTVSKLSKVAEHVEDSLDPTTATRAPVEVRLADDTTLLERLEGYVSPFQHALGMGGIVALLLVFLLLEREEIGDRIVQLAGRGRLSVTTRMLSQVGTRLSKYLATFALVNLAFGLIITVMLWGVGVPYAILWGALAALLRFIPYIGPMVAFALPTVFSIAYFDTWTRPIVVMALYGTIEVVANSVEPMLYGKTTGVSALSLLIAALFWTWMWGPLGLLLSTPLTVCLMVLGSQIPELSFFATLLQEDLEIEDDLRLYQRLLHRDHDGAIEFLDELMANRSPDRVFDGVVVPALSRATIDHEHGVLDHRDLVFLWGAIQQWLEDTPLRPDPATEDAGTIVPDEPPRRLIGVATHGVSDVLVLRMLGRLLEGRGVTLQVVEAYGSTLNVSEQIAAMEPNMILISYLPPVGLARTRYLGKRLKAHFGELPVVVGYWDQHADPTLAAEPLRSLGLFKTVFTLAAARDLVIGQFEDTSAKPLAIGAPRPGASGTKPADVEVYSPSVTVTR